MKCHTFPALTAAAMLFLTGGLHLHADTQPVGTTFAYQGQLNQAGEPVNGDVDLLFRLYDGPTGFNQIGPTLFIEDFAVIDGVFTIDLDFGEGVFTGEPRWLEININGVTLSPRQPIMPSPYAMVATTAANVPPKAMTGSYAGITGVGTLDTLNVLGNVGIGTTNPATGLHLVGDRFRQSGSGGEIEVWHGSSHGVMGTISNTDLSLRTGDTDRLRISADGNIGIGTTSPAEQLHVAGNLRVNGITFGALNSQLHEGDLNDLVDPGVYKFTSSGTINTPPTGAGVILQLARSPSRQVQLAFAAPSSSNDGFRFAGRTFGDNGWEAWNELSFQNGNVGIGTTSPSHPLHVINDSSSSRAIFAHHTASDGTTYGGHFRSDSTGGRGVVGWVTAETDTTRGVHGLVNSTEGRAVFGEATATSGPALGGRFQSSSSEGRGVYGLALAQTGATRGVQGQVNSPDGFAGYFTGPEGSRNYFERRVGIGTAEPAAPLQVSGNVICGISENIASGVNSFVSGGSVSDDNVFPNTASGALSFVGGGTNNTASELYSFVGGGRANTASGAHSFAAGRRAKAEHTGTFVWADFGNDADFASTGVNQFLIRANGGVGINTNNPGVFDLAVDGSAAKPGGGSWSIFSDARLKHDIVPIAPGMLDRLLALNGYTFEYDDEAIEHRLALPGTQIGLIAQEVAEVFPDWVNEDEDGYLYVTERGLTAIVVEALRDLRAEKDAQIDTLRSENESLHERLAVLEDVVAQLHEQMTGGGR